MNNLTGLARSAVQRRSWVSESLRARAENAAVKVRQAEDESDSATAVSWLEVLLVALARDMESAALGWFEGLQS